MYDNKHRYFVQYMLKHGCISTDQAITIVNTINDDKEKMYDLKDVKLFVNEINEKITTTELRLAFLQCEITGIDNLVLMNMGRDQVSRAQQAHSPSALEYFHSIMMEIVTGETRNILQNTALNLASHISKRLSRQDAQDLLFKWKVDGYLVLKGGKVYLGPRSIVEYTTFFRQECKDYVHICDLCSELVFIGSTCASCQQLMHKHCLERFLSKRSVCPNCKKAWVEADGDVTQNNETAVPESMDDGSSSDEEPVTAPSQRTRRK